MAQIIALIQRASIPGMVAMACYNHCTLQRHGHLPSQVGPGQSFLSEEAEDQGIGDGMHGDGCELHPEMPVKDTTNRGLVFY